MGPIKIVAIVLIVGGVLALGYGGFSYTKETHKAEIGPPKIQGQEKDQGNIPQWAGVGALVARGGLLGAGEKKSGAQEVERRAPPPGDQRAGSAPPAAA